MTLNDMHNQRLFRFIKRAEGHIYKHRAPSHSQSKQNNVGKNPQDRFAMSITSQSKRLGSLSVGLLCSLLAISAMVHPAESQVGISNLLTGFDIGQQIAVSYK